MSRKILRLKILFGKEKSCIHLLPLQYEPLVLIVIDVNFKSLNFKRYFKFVN
ncbi:hypothetical protein LINPERHAP1_LOCUS14167 [Linum perenne]